MYQNNPNIVNANLSAHSAATKQAVQNALDIGHEVTIHERPITQSGWTGAGYTTIDPSTGAGGYMIEGGSNGGSLDLVDGDEALLINIAAILIGIAGVLGGLLATLLNIFTAIDTYLDMQKYAGCPGFELGYTAVNYLNVFSILLGLFGLFAAFLNPLAGAYFFLIGVVLFVLGYVLGEMVTMIWQNTCRR